MNRRSFVAVSSAFCALARPGVVRAADPRADAIFSSAKNVWRTRVEAPYVSFGLRERYAWRGKTHDNWWSASYRDDDRALALRRAIVPGDEAQRLRGTAIALNLRLHHGTMRADTIETNADADAFPILDPLIEPNASFGLLRREQHAVLARDGIAGAAADGPATAAPTRFTAVPDALPTPGEHPLRELIRVEAVARDYTIALAGVENVRGADAYHLTLTPMRDPRINRLRDLWVDATNYGTLQLAVDGLFTGKPYEDARWTVTYVTLEERTYVQQVRTADTLRFGLDRFVDGLQFDLVDYAFPASISPFTFERLI